MLPVPENETNFDIHLFAFIIFLVCISLLSVFDIYKSLECNRDLTLQKNLELTRLP